MERNLGNDFVSIGQYYLVGFGSYSYCAPCHGIHILILIDEKPSLIKQFAFVYLTHLEYHDKGGLVDSDRQILLAPELCTLILKVPELHPICTLLLLPTCSNFKLISYLKWKIHVLAQQTRVKISVQNPTQLTWIFKEYTTFYSRKVE
jgi:hypothetical protein